MALDLLLKNLQGTEAWGRIATEGCVQERATSCLDLEVFGDGGGQGALGHGANNGFNLLATLEKHQGGDATDAVLADRKSTRLNSSHSSVSRMPSSA